MYRGNPQMLQYQVLFKVHPKKMSHDRYENI